MINRSTLNGRAERLIKGIVEFWDEVCEVGGEWIDVALVAICGIKVHVIV